MIKTAEAMVKCLEQEGIKVVFGYPGAAICPFYGVGEQIDDLQPFNPSDFAKALFTKDSKEE